MLQEAGHIKNSYFDFPAHSRFIFDEFWGSLGTSIFGKWSSAASNTRSWLPSRLSLRFFICDYDQDKVSSLFFVMIFIVQIDCSTFILIFLNLRSLILFQNEIDFTLFLYYVLHSSHWLLKFYFNFP